MKLLDEIRQQPEHIRHLFMWTLVVITFSVVGFVWFGGAQKRFAALINPNQQQNGTALADAADKKDQAPSPFEAIVNTIGNLRANISELIAGKPTSITSDAAKISPVPPQVLPVK